MTVIEPKVKLTKSEVAYILKMYSVCETLDLDLWRFVHTVIDGRDRLGIIRFEYETDEETTFE